MKDYKLEIGNSTTGQIGLVAYCQAPNKRAALKKFQQELHRFDRNEPEGTVMLRRGKYYQAVFINWRAVTLKDIEEDARETTNSAEQEDALRKRLRSASFAYLNEEAARAIARADFAEFEIAIVHSPHGDNPSVKGHRMDYWIDEPHGILRAREGLLYTGLGAKA